MWRTCRGLQARALILGLGGLLGLNAVMVLVASACFAFCTFVGFCRFLMSVCACATMPEVFRLERLSLFLFVFVWLLWLLPMSKVGSVTVDLERAEGLRGRYRQGVVELATQRQPSQPPNAATGLFLVGVGYSRYMSCPLPFH